MKTALRQCIEPPDAFRAAVLYRPGEALVLEEDIGIPTLRTGQVLVRIAYSGVCRSQVMEARGHRGEDRYLPHLLGHEGSGIVAAVGPGVRKVAPGDRVILGWIRGEGIDSGGTIYRNGRGAQLHAGPVATFATWGVVSENRLVPLPPGLPLDIAVLFGCAVPTGAGILINEIRPAPGSRIAFFGMGGIGLCA